jgi:hypothetical protein
MNDRTGEIRELTPEEAARVNALGDPKLDGTWHDVSHLSENERLMLQGMNRKDRRAYFAKQRKAKGGKRG